MSIYDVPYFVRSERFIKTTLVDIGKVVNPQSIISKSNRLDVIKLMIYTDSLEPIRNRVKSCVDGIWFNLFIIKEVYLHKEESEGSLSILSSSSEGGEYSSFLKKSNGKDEPP